MAEKITKDMSIADAMKICPNAPAIFDKHGMACWACMAASAETIEEGALMHEIDAQAIIDELNADCKEDTSR